MSRTLFPRARTLAAATAVASLSVVGLPLAAGNALAAGGTVLAFTAPASITYSHAARLSGRLVKAGSGKSLAGRVVLLQGRPVGTTRWTTSTSTHTAVNGTFRLTVRPARNTVYRAYSPAAAGLGRSNVVTRQVGVHPLLTATLDLSSVASNGVFHVTVTLAPAQPGGTVEWQQVSGGSWTDGGAATLNSSSSAVIGLSSTGTGTLQLRAVTRASGRLLAGQSAPVSISVTAPPVVSPPAPPAPPAPPSFPGNGGLPPMPTGTGLH